MSRHPGPDAVEPEFLQLALWDQLNAAEAERVARALELGLPEPWKFARVQECAMGGRRRQVAFFKWRRGEFALVPGGEVTLGYDPARPPKLSRAQRASYNLTRREYDLPTLPEYLAEVLTPIRTVSLAPLLMEARPRECPGTLGQVLAGFAADGFRTPTPDEWEHACGGGSRTLWRWGDDTPDAYDCNVQGWHHCQANAFGLHIAYSTYHSAEYCSPPACARGGDGGASTCGGLGFFLAWLVLATSYAGGEAESDWNVYRRCYALPV
jgi:hypothetical protein